MANLNSADILGVDWSRRARELLSGAGIKPSRQEGPSLRYEKVDPMAHREPIVIKEKNAVTDPDSWLNRGLGAILENASDIILGKESGNALVDYGASNIPGVGAGAILAAGGMPGLVDATGLGALKNAKKLVKPVKEFILRNAGEEGLQAVDNYLTRFPKVGKLTFADANELLTSGKLGQRFNVQFDIDNLVGIADNGLNENISKLLEMYKDKLPQSDKEVLIGIQNAFRTAVDRGDIADAANISAAYYANMQNLTSQNLQSRGRALMYPGDLTKLSDEGKFDIYRRRYAKNMTNPEIQYMSTSKIPEQYAAEKDKIIDESRRMNEYIGVQMHPVQDFDKIEAAQLRRDAQQAEKAAKKAAKKSGTPQNPTVNIVTSELAPVPPPEPVAPVVTEVPKAPAVPEPPKGGPNKWRENGWVSTEHPISEPGVDYSLLGKDANEEDRRALFVIDSLANEAVAKLIRNNRFKDEWPGRAPLRHQGTNYDSKSRDYGMDVAWNARTGNLPRGTSALVLRNAVSSAGNRLPGQMTGVVDGKDLYDLLFRKKVDRRINELDNRYRVDF